MKRTISFFVLFVMVFVLFSTPALADVEQNGLPEVYPVTASDAGMKTAPLECFTMYGEENKLKGTAFYLVGKVDECGEISGDKGPYQYFTLQTENGYACILDIYTYMITNYPEEQAKLALEPESDYTFPKDGDFVKVVCIYSGYSKVLNMPVFYYGMPEIIMDQFRQQTADSETNHTPTTGETNAVKKAKSYLGVMAFSYKGMIEQLEYNGFSHEEAVYGADNCGANWKEQAAKKAESYLSIMAFSKSGLIEQLEYNGFTHEEAVYGAEQNGY